MSNLNKIEWYNGVVYTTAEIYEHYGFNGTLPSGDRVQDVVWTVITQGEYNNPAFGLSIKLVTTETEATETEATETEATETEATETEATETEATETEATETETEKRYYNKFGEEIFSPLHQRHLTRIRRRLLQEEEAEFRDHEYIKYLHRLEASFYN